MAPPPSDPSPDDVVRRQQRGPQFKILIPLIYAPVLPLIRISLRHKPVLRDRLFTVALAGAFAHGLYLVTDILTQKASDLVEQGWKCLDDGLPRCLHFTSFFGNSS
ncbi:uncharacterized protein LOC125193321 [Salvia hispanica]|uniref:uncharacterized protein LOC125193321 n=1 Tax=Salvia hispanica TaxID=49212 RepID=UPI0020099951|nr:uncharacterized protein LOC125193321 [Salvia hispanica]